MVRIKRGVVLELNSFPKNNKNNKKSARYSFYLFIYIYIFKKVGPLCYFLTRVVNFYIFLCEHITNPSTKGQSLGSHKSARIFNGAEARKPKLPTAKLSLKFLSISLSTRLRSGRFFSFYIYIYIIFRLFTALFTRSYLQFSVLGEIEN